MAQLVNPYDEVQYRSTCFAASHLDNLFVQGVLSGLNPAPVQNCRVLEIGCAGGGNLIPMAAMFPESAFLGFDLSKKQVDQANDLVRRSALTNVQIVVDDILGFQPEGKFDYILAHGIYSWVPLPVREALMALIRQSLSPNGIAYLCFNALPGFRLKQITRDMMRFHGRGAGTVHEQLTKAREILGLAAGAVPQQRTNYLTAVRSLVPELLASGDWLLAHDDLEEVCDPVYLHEFISHCAAHDLTYLGGARPTSNLAAILPAELRAKLADSCRSATDMEQYCDFLFGTRYRDAVLTISDNASPAAAGYPAVKKMFFAGKFAESSVEAVPPGNGGVRFENQVTQGAATLGHAGLIQLLRLLHQRWPLAVSFDELRSAFHKYEPTSEASEDFLAYSLHALYCNNVVELWSRPTSFIAVQPQKPRMTQLARVQAEMGGPVATLRHREFLPVDAFVQKMVPLMDGSRDREALAGLLLQFLKREAFDLRSKRGSIQTVDDARLFIDEAMQVFEDSSMFAAG